MPATRVMVVEDEGLIANDLASRLRRDGYEVAGIADSAEEALKTIPEISPDLVLMDIRLRGKMESKRPTGCGAISIYPSFS